MYYGILSEARVQWWGEARKRDGLETASKSWESSETIVVQVHASGETDLLDMIERTACHLFYEVHSSSKGNNK